MPTTSGPASGDPNPQINAIDSAVDNITSADRRNVQLDEAYRGAERKLNPEQIQRFRNAEEIVQFVEREDNRKYRERNLEKRYGQGALAEFRKYLAGEYDFEVSTDGEIRKNAWNEMSRKALISVFNRRNVVGAIGLGVVALFTGGVGLAACGALLGAAGGRAVAEAWEMFKGEERKLREQIAVLEFEHAQAMKDFAKKRRELIREGNEDEANKILHQIVDLFYIESEEIASTRSKLADTKSQWDKRRGTLTMIGGFTGAAIGIYAGMANLGQTAAETKSALTNARVDLDGNGIYHNVEKVNGAWHFLYNDAQEIAKAKVFASKYGYDLTISRLTSSPGHILPGVTDEMIKNALAQGTQTGTGGVINTLSHLSPLWKEIGRSAGVLGGMFLAGVGGDKKEVLDTGFDEMEKKRIKDQLPKVKDIGSTQEEEGGEKTEPVIGQQWTFKGVEEYFSGRDYNDIRDCYIEIPNPNDPANPVRVDFGTYKVEKITGNKVTLIRMGDSDPARPYADASGNNYRVTIKKEDLQKLGEIDSERMTKRGYQKHWEKLAEYLENQIPQKGEVWQFTDLRPGSQFDSIFGRAITIPGGEASKWSVASIRNNEVRLQRLGANNQIIQPPQELRVHIGDMLYKGRAERSDQAIATDQETLKRLGIDPADLKDHRFRSPAAANLTDNYGNAINPNIECRVSAVDMDKGLITLEAVRAVNRIRPKYVIRISELVGANPWQALASPESAGATSAESKGEKINTWNEFLERMVDGGMIGDDERKEIKKGKSIFSDAQGTEYVIQRFKYDANNPDNSEVMLRQLDTRQVQRRGVQVDAYFLTRNKETENISDFIANYQYTTSNEKINR